MAPRPGPVQSRPSGARAYAIATAAALAAVALSLVLDTVSPTLYAPLVAAAVLSVTLLGLGPALVTVAVGWSVAIWAMVEPQGAFDVKDADGMTRWAVNLGLALGIVVIVHFLRGERAEARAAAEAAEEVTRGVEMVRDLASILSSAATWSDIAHALVTKTPAVIGARGGAVALLDGDELVVVDPQGGALETHRAGERLPLSLRAPIARAAAGGRAVVVRSRAEFEREFPDGLRLSPFAQAAIAVPLVVADDVVGSVSFLFDDPASMSEDAEAFVHVAAELGDRALERAGHYERELETRRALDRLLQAAPMFLAESADAVVGAICREARTAFGSDYGFLWRFHADELELLASDPPTDTIPGHTRLPLDDFPHLADAVRQLRSSFVQNVEREAVADGLALIRRLGIRSSLRIPVVVGGQAELLLSVSWQTVVSEPDPLTLLVARRFADQAGLALAQLERRRAEAEADRRADEALRLQDVTAQLSAAATPGQVSAICLEQALSALGASAGFVILRGTDGTSLDLGARRGLSEAELASWQLLAEDGGGALARTLESGAVVWPEAANGVEAPVTVPLLSGGSVRGALYVLLPGSVTVDDHTRNWVQTVVSHCAQALERSRLLAEEQRLRLRSELVQRLTMRLSNAVSRQEVASVVIDEVGAAAEADGVVLAVVPAERGTLQPFAWRGVPDEVVARWLELPLDSLTPAARAIRRRSSGFYGNPGEIRRAFPHGGDALAATGHESFLFVPLVVGREVRALLVLSWADERAPSDDLQRLVESLAGQAAQAIDRAAHIEWERTVAETLQRSILPVALPKIDGIELAARYLPGTAELQVGGDWFDAIPLPDGKLGLVVGDVVGKGVTAAANMAQLRNGLRAFSLDPLKPSSAMARLNRLAFETLDDPFATVVYATLDRDAGICRITSAGHPPPIVAFGDGRVEFLESARGLPLGADPGAQYSHDAVELPAGSVLVLYTDGLVERRDRPLDEGLELLRRTVAEAPREPERLVETVVERLVGTQERGDDIALLAVRLFPVAPTPLRLRMPMAPESARTARDSLRAWLAGTALDPPAARDVVLAAWEACVNAIEHGGDTGGTQLVVSAGVEDSAVRIRVEDDGSWLPPQERPERGLGLQLMRSLVSSVDVSAVDTGTTVTLTRRTDDAPPALEEPDEQHDEDDQG